MLRIFLALLCVLALAGFTEPGGKYTVEFPAGWSEPVRSHENGTIQSNAPVEGVWCRTNSVPLDTLDGKTQEQLNDDFAAPFDHATWAGFLIADPTTFTESDREVRMADGRVVQWATLTFKPEVTGAALKARLAVNIMPGHVANAACFAPIGQFEGYGSLFEAVLKSLKPR